MSGNVVEFRVGADADLAKARRLLADLVVGERLTGLRPGATVNLRPGRLLQTRRALLLTVGGFVAQRQVVQKSAKPAANKKPKRRPAPAPGSGSGLMSTAIGQGARRAESARQAAPRLEFVPRPDASHGQLREHLRALGVDPRQLDRITPGRPIPIRAGEALKRMAATLSAFGVIRPAA